MHIEADTLDDVLRKCFPALLQDGARHSATRGAFRELRGVVVQLNQPRARLSRTEVKGQPFSSMGELLWYLSQSDRLEFIEYYIDSYDREAEEDGRIHGAYGPRLFDMHGQDQVHNVVEQLRKHPGTRRAVIQLFDATDLEAPRKKDIPCTCTLQFVLRDGALEMIASLRSSDAFKGLSHDVFAFTMLQELVAAELDVALGPYRHFAGSLHIYENCIDRAKRYLGEGWQETVLMPAAPRGDWRPAVSELLRVEHDLRLTGAAELEALEAHGDYWHDLGRILLAYRAHRDRTSDQIPSERAIATLEGLKCGMGRYFHTYIDRKVAGAYAAAKKDEGKDA